jgi:adenosine deaminase
VVGVDVAGGEEWFSRAADGPRGMHGLHAAALAAAARKYGLHVTLHAGENTTAANVGAAVFEHGASRIGHGCKN